MCPKIEKNREAAFTLVELLVVIALLGIVTMAISNLYVSTQRHASTTEEVSDVQQNIRVALDFMTRDMRNSGFLLPVGQPSVSGAPYFLCRDLNADGDCADVGESFNFVLQTAAPLGKIAKVSTDFTSAAGTQVVEISAADMVDLFDSGASGDFVRIFRPGLSGPVQDTIYQVSAKDRGATPPTLTLTGFTASSAFMAGDIIVGIPEAGPIVNTITYTLEHDPESSDPRMRRLTREINSTGAQVLANKINDIGITYIMKDGAIRSADPAPTGDECLDIAAVRLNVQGATDVTRTGQPGISGVKSRGIETTVKIRNL
jgi:prepilin-type N-terminal cleavage/methylation domain-containing protein